VTAGEPASTETVSYRFVKIETMSRGRWRVRPNRDHTARARYAVHRVRVAIDERAVSLPPPTELLSAASIPG
jgi:hypothetical protein